MRGVLGELASIAGDRFDLGPVITEADALLADTTALHAATRSAARDAATVERLNACIMALGRRLTPINYTFSGEYEHDLALGSQPIPVLQPIRQLVALDPASSEAHYLSTQLVRARNRVWHAFHEARQAIAAAVA
jgi:hypothetical protein